MTGDRVIEGVLASHDPEATAAKVRAIREERVEFARVLVETAGRFPTYEVPPEVAERYPLFDPGDPETWPDPDKCTEGRPWGIDAYGSVWGDYAGRWRMYLSGMGGRTCRNRWRDPELRLCGTHRNSYRETLDSERKRLARYEREEEHRDLARHLAAYAIEADSSPAGVLLTADACRALLRILAEADRVAPL